MVIGVPPGHRTGARRHRCHYRPEADRHRRRRRVRLIDQPGHPVARTTATPATALGIAACAAAAAEIPAPAPAAAGTQPPAGGRSTRAARQRSAILPACATGEADAASASAGAGATGASAFGVERGRAAGFAPASRIAAAAGSSGAAAGAAPAGRDYQGSPRVKGVDQSRKTAATATIKGRCCVPIGVVTARPATTRAASRPPERWLAGAAGAAHHYDQQITRMDRDRRILHRSPAATVEVPVAPASGRARRGHVHHRHRVRHGEAQHSRRRKRTRRRGARISLWTGRIRRRGCERRPHQHHTPDPGHHHCPDPDA